jgi:hypothetical protein
MISPRLSNAGIARQPVGLYVGAAAPPPIAPARIGMAVARFWYGNARWRHPFLGIAAEEIG